MSIGIAEGVLLCVIASVKIELPAFAPEREYGNAAIPARFAAQISAEGVSPFLSRR